MNRIRRILGTSTPLAKPSSALPSLIAVAGITLALGAAISTAVAAQSPKPKVAHARGRKVRKVRSPQTKTGTWRVVAASHLAPAARPSSALTVRSLTFVSPSAAPAGQPRAYTVLAGPDSAPATFRVAARIAPVAKLSSMLSVAPAQAEIASPEAVNVRMMVPKGAPWQIASAGLTPNSTISARAIPRVMRAPASTGGFIGIVPPVAVTMSRSSGDESGRLVSIDAQRMDFDEALQTVCAQASRSYVVEPGNFPRIILHADNQPFDEVIQAACFAAGAKYERKNGIYYFRHNNEEAVPAPTGKSK